MSQRTRVVVLWAWCAAQLVGCAQSRTRHYLGDADFKYYQNSATAIEYPNVATALDESAVLSLKPPTVRDPSQAEPWNLTLADAVQTAISNSKVIRSRGAFKSPGNPLMMNPDRVASGYDAAIQETSQNFFQRGPEAALSAFDTQFQMALGLGRNEAIQNNALLAGGILGGGELLSDTAKMQTSLTKIMANGGQFAVSHDWNYSHTNQPFQLFPGYYRPISRAEYRQPLLAGAGTEFTQIAGPIARSIPGLYNVDQGVLIARINTDLSLADFELNTINLVKDVEDQYWELYLAYRTYDAELEAQKAAHNFWQVTKRRVDAGAKKGAAIDEGQARENYFGTRARVENAIATLYSTEGQLRRMLGLPVNDGRIIRPADEPLSAEFLGDWTMALTESLSRRVELRRQKWQIKSLELQLRAAESLVKPRLDFIGGYQLNGFGENLFGQNDPNGTREQQFQSAYDSLTSANQKSWDLALQLQLPVGLRQALAQKRNLELRVTKARAVLAAQELEVSHELGNTFAQIDTWYQLAETNLDRVVAANKQLETVEREYEAGRIQVDLLLRTQANLAAAQTSYHTALTRYNQAITDFRLRKGTLLEENNIFLAEGDWTPAAQEESLRRAWARSYASPSDKVKDSTEPLAVPGVWPTSNFTPYVDPAVQMPQVPTLQPIPVAPQAEPVPGPPTR